MSNPILDFGIERESLQYIGEGLQRPECILAERDGTLWSADSRGDVVRIATTARKRSSRSASPNLYIGSLRGQRIPTLAHPPPDCPWSTWNDRY